MDAEGPLDAGAALAGPAAHNPQGMAGEIQVSICELIWLRTVGGMSSP